MFPNKNHNKGALHVNINETLGEKQVKNGPERHLFSPSFGPQVIGPELLATEAFKGKSDRLIGSIKFSRYGNS